MKLVTTIMVGLLVAGPALAIADGRLAPQDLPTPSPPVTAGARLWTPVSWGGEPGNMQLYFVEKASIRRNGSLVELITLAVNEMPTQGGVDRVEEHSRIMCDARTAISIRQRYYGGARQLHLIEPRPNVESFPEGSAWRVLIDGVCGNDMKAKPTNDPRTYADAFFHS